MTQKTKLEGFWIPWLLGLVFGILFLVELLVLANHKTNFTIEIFAHSVSRHGGFWVTAAHTIGVLMWLFWAGISLLMFWIADDFYSAKEDKTMKN